MCEIQWITYPSIINTCIPVIKLAMQNFAIIFNNLLVEIGFQFNVCNTKFKMQGDKCSNHATARQNWNITGDRQQSPLHSTQWDHIDIHDISSVTETYKLWMILYQRENKMCWTNYAEMSNSKKNYHEKDEHHRILSKTISKNISAKIFLAALILLDQLK